MINDYYPGNPVRSSLQSYVDGQYVDPPIPPTVTITFPDGTTSQTSGVRDSLGLWHADFLIPFPMLDGVATIVWRVVGVPVLANATAVDRIYVKRIPAAA